MTQCRRCAELEAELERMRVKMENMRKDHNEEMREAARDTRDAVAEARWEGRDESYR